MDKEKIAEKIRLAEEQKKANTLLHEIENEHHHPQQKISEILPKEDINVPSHHQKN